MSKQCDFGRIALVERAYATRVLAALSLAVCLAYGCSSVGEKYTAGTVRGRVYEGASGSTVQGALVAVAVFHGDPADSQVVGGGEVRSDARGGYELSWGWLGGGSGAVVVRAHATSSGYSALDTMTSIPVHGTREDNNAILDLPLRPSGL